MIQIDGAFGEGGGQIVRTSVSLAAITGQAVEIVHIRAGRGKPGLQAQHLTSVLAAGKLCGAEMVGAELGSQSLRFVPTTLLGSVATSPESLEFRFDVAEARGGASAGATGLVAQTLLVPLAFLPPSLTTLCGGTHVPMAPPADYLEGVYLPMLRRMGLEVELESLRAGFYPKGGGEIVLSRTGGGLQTPIDLTERGRLQRLIAYVTTAQLPDHVGARADALLRKELKGFGVPVEVELRALESHGPGAAMLLVAECQNGRAGWVSLGERGKPMERVATETVRGFRDWQAKGPAVDEHLADQLVLPCALIPGESRWTTPSITEHLRTVLFVAQQFLPVRYSLTEQPDGTGTVVLQGVRI